MREKLKKRNLKRILKGSNMVRNQRDENEIISTRSHIISGSSGVLSSNGTANVSITNVAPAGVTTATISKWMVIDDGGTTYFIPMWT